MDQRERSDDLMEAFRAAMDGREAHTWQGGPGIVQSFDAVAMTCVVQPAIQGRVSAKDGTVKFVSLPLLLDVPAYFPAGGGATLTFPVAKGDECYFSIADRCIDAWWQSGGIQPPMEARMHDLSDAFAFVGVRSQPRKLANVSTNSTQLRSDDGATVVDLNPTAKTLTLTAPGGGTIDANTTINGTLHVTGAVTFDSTFELGGNATFNGSSVQHGGKEIGKAHDHGGVQTGSGVSGPVN